MPEAVPIFALFLGVAGIVLFNLMTAIVVKNAFDAAEADEETGDVQNSLGVSEWRCIDLNSVQKTGEECNS